MKTGEKSKEQLRQELAVLRQRLAEMEAVNKTRLHRAEEARRAAEKAVERVASLQAVTAALSAARTPEQVGRVVIEQGLAVLGASAGSVTLLDRTGTRLEIMAAIGYPPQILDKWRTFPLASPAPLALTVRTGQAIFIGSRVELEEQLPDFARVTEMPQPAFATVPLETEGRIMGGMGLNFDQPHAFDPADQSFIQALARHCAQALDRARLYQEAQTEVIARRLAEEQLQVLLEEKDVLLREVHHRVKNNLQAISNLLYLQAAPVQDEQTRLLFRETQDRIKSIALIHESLYQSKNLARLDFAEYARKLANHLIYSYAPDPSRVRLDVRVEAVSLDVDMAVSIGVIINELITNVLKHAFPGGRAGEIGLELWPDEAGRLVLVVRDDGVGLPPEVELDHSPSLGLHLVKMMTGHMKGAITLQSGPGLVVKIIFPPP